MPLQRKPLNSSQQEVLLTLYKFRFCTRDLITKYQGLTSSTNTHYRLQVLLEQEYIGRNFNGSYRLAGKPASYYLLRKGISFLKPNPNLYTDALNLTYKDKDAGEVFIARCLTIFELYNKFIRLYGGMLEFYAKNELIEYDHFPSPRPDGFISFSDKYERLEDVMLELVMDVTPMSAVRRRLTQYFQHFESGEWEEETKANYPTLLLVCETPGVEWRTQKLFSRILSSTDADELDCYTTTLKALSSALSARDAVWSNVLDPEEPVSLSGE